MNGVDGYVLLDAAQDHAGDRIIGIDFFEPFEYGWMVHNDQVEPFFNHFINHFLRQIKGNDCAKRSGGGIPTDQAAIVILLL